MITKEQYAILKDLWLLSAYARCWHFPIVCEDIGSGIEVKIVNFNPIVLSACGFFAGIGFENFSEGRMIVPNEIWESKVEKI